MAEGPIYITTAKVSSTLGVSEQSVRTWCRLGLIPATRPAGTRKWLILEEEFRKWLASGTGERVADFLDPAHRSASSEDELLADAKESLARRKASTGRNSRSGRQANGKPARQSA